MLSWKPRRSLGFSSRPRLQISTSMQTIIENVGRSLCFVSMRRIASLMLACGLFGAIRAADPPFQVEIDFSAAPQCEPFAIKAKAIVEEWYPKINELLFDKARPLPRAKVRLKFEPMKGVAHATND